MMKQTFGALLLLLLAAPGFAQYQFTTEQELECTPIKNQQRTGTCWSFTTVSFLESELMRMGEPAYDLSEMYMVRKIYEDKAMNYLLRQGKANFSQGSLSHDVMRAFEMAGAMPESAYSGKPEGDAIYDHSEMESALKGLLDGLVGSKRLSNKWKGTFAAVLNNYMGAVPESFKLGGKTYTAESFAKSLPIDPEDYVTLTSFTHHTFYDTFILEIPDNYSNGTYYNLPLDELQAIAEYALSNGYTVAWDGDVSEKGFSAGEGLAILPQNEDDPNRFRDPADEVDVTQEKRQRAFESYATTDDHLMHLTGIAKDQEGQTYFITKNSWGEISNYKGFLYMSVPYFRMKTVGMMVHKDALPEDIVSKLKL